MSVGRSIRTTACYGRGTCEAHSSTFYMPRNKKGRVHVCVNLRPCLFGLSATSQQYFSLRTNPSPTSSTFLSEQISTNHRPPAKQTGCRFTCALFLQQSLLFPNYPACILSRFLSRKEGSSILIAETRKQSILANDRSGSPSQQRGSTFSSHLVKSTKTKSYH
jgi:hypothetical protein